MMRPLFPLVVGLLLFAEAAQAAPSGITLDEAIATALAQQPQLRQASASVAAAEARRRGTQASQLPQVSLNSGYQAATTGGGASLGTSVSQLLYDFGQSSSRTDAAAAQLDVQRAAALQARQQALLAVRTVYFDAQAARAGIASAKETFANQQRHFDSIQRMVQIGTRAPIDLALARKDLANAQLQVIRAESAYGEAKARLNQAMGREGSLDFEVTTGAYPAVAGEGAAIEALVAEALANRPDFAALQAQQRAQEASVRAAKSANTPTLRATVGANATDRTLAVAGPTVTGGLNLSWPLWNGGSHQAQADEAEASLAGLEAQADAQRLQVRLELEQARLAITAGKAAVKAAGESLASARKQLTLAEGRYASGVGNIIELSDAQLAVTNAQTQQIQEERGLAQARARLLKALGRS